ncbi:MAG: oligosaccharide flippase family protein [Candidatus Omnitrophica bacterium]|nr:oligosaccharide flippase family protein [Candidatus Omnitrophota bacterium]
MTSKAKLLIKGSFLSTISFVINIVVSFLLMPFIIITLGDRYYGLWVVVGSMIGYYWLADLGVGSAVERYISREIAVTDESRDDRINTVLNTGVLIFSLAGLLILVFTLIICLFLPFFVKNVAEISLFRSVFVVMGLSFALTFPLRAFSGLVRAFLRFDVFSVTEIVIILTRAVLIILVLKSRGGLVGLAVITLFMDLCSRGTHVYFAKKVFPSLKLDKRFIRKEDVKRLFSYGGFTYLSSIANQLRYNVDNLVIAGFMGLSWVTPYSIASRLVLYFRKFVGNLFEMTMPLFSQWEGISAFDHIKTNFLFLTKFNVYLATFISGMLLCVGKEFILRWMGPKYLDSYPILVVLILAFFIALLQQTSVSLLKGISKQKFCAGIDIAEGIINLLLSMFLVRKYGLLGVAWGTVIPSFFAQLIILPVYVCRQIKLNLWDYYLHLLGALLKAAGIILCGYWALKTFLYPSYLRIFGFGLIQAGLFTFIIFKIGFTEVERKLIIERVTRREK